MFKGIQRHGFNYQGMHTLIKCMGGFKLLIKLFNLCLKICKYKNVKLYNQFEPPSPPHTHTNCGWSLYMLQATDGLFLSQWAVLSCNVKQTWL